MTTDEGDEPMQAPVEVRLQYLEERVRTLESLVGAPQAPLQAAPAAPPVPQPEPWPPPSRAAPLPSPRVPLDFEELLGGRVLAWLGGIAVFLAVVFFLAMAVHNGWIDEPTRVALAFLGSSALLGAGVWL